MTKKNLILGGVLIVLLALAFAYNGPFEAWRKDFGKPSNFLKSIDIAKINKIELSEDGETVVINKKDDRWLIDGTKDFYLTTQVAITAFDTLIEAKKADIMLVSDDANKEQDFEIGEANGATLTLKNGDEKLISFFIGKNGGDFKSTYIAEVNSKKIYTVDANLNLAFRHNDWYDRSVLELEADKITKIRFQYPSREFSIERQMTEGEEAEMSEWAGILPYKFSVDQDKIADIVDILSAMNAKEIPVQTFEGTGLEKNLAIIQITGEDIDSVIMIGEDNGNELYFVKRGDSDNIYLIEKEARDGLEKRISDLR